jgi:hypothetical protein
MIVVGLLRFIEVLAIAFFGLILGTFLGIKLSPWIEKSVDVVGLPDTVTWLKSALPGLTSSLPGFPRSNRRRHHAISSRERLYAGKKRRSRSNRPIRPGRRPVPHLRLQLARNGSQDGEALRRTTSQERPAIALLDRSAQSHHLPASQLTHDTHGKAVSCPEPPHRRPV